MPTMLIYRLAGGLCHWALRVRGCAGGKLVWEIDYEHIGEQPHRTDFEAIEATCKKHNRDKAHEYSQFILCNPGYKARLDQMADEYKLHVQTVIKSHSTWDGVPAPLKATHRNVDAVLTPKEYWEKQPVTV